MATTFPNSTGRTGLPILPAVALGIAFLSVVGLPPAAQSQPPDDVDSTSSVEQSLESPSDDGSWIVRLRPADDRKDAGRLLSVFIDDADRPAAEVALPVWAAPPEYDLASRAERLADDTAALLVEVAPSSKSDNPATDVTIQVAWRARRDTPDEDWTWKLVARVQRSGLDGGRQLEFRSSGEYHDLVEIPEHAASTFCGPGERRDVPDRTYDVDTGKFVRDLDLERHSKGARKLDAALPQRPLAGPFTREVFQWYWASSNAQTSSDTSGPTRPLELGDRRGGSAWTVDARDGVRGEYATANVVEALPVRALQIVPGLASDRETFRTYGKPRRLLLSFSDGSRFIVSIPEVSFEDLVDRNGLVVELPEPIRTSCLSVIYLTADDAPAPPEDGSRPVAIAELVPLTVVDAATATETAEAIVERVADEPDLRHRRRIAHTADRLQKELTDAVEKALTRTEGTERRRIIPLLENLPPDRAVPILMEFLERLDSDAVEFRAVKRSLATHHERAAAPVADLIVQTEVDDPKYVDLVRLLGRVGRPSHLSKLIEDFGKGSEFLRNERIRAVAAGGKPLLSKLFSVVAVEGSTGKVRDALKAVYLIGKRHHRDEIGTHRGADSLREVFDHSEDRRTLMHAFRAARYYRVDRFVSLVRDDFLEHDDALVRAASMEAVARYPSPEARTLLEEALDDRDPDVRIAAIDGLGSREDRRRAVDAILGYVRREEWSSGRQNALNVLAEVDIPETREYFHELLRERRNDRPGLALRAATTLGRADRSIEASLAREIALDETARRRLRLEMIDLLGLDDSDAGEAFLLTLINPAEAGQYIDDPDLLRDLERRALLSLGRRRSTRARPRLLKMAKTGSDLKLRRHALRALAFFQGSDLVEELESWRRQAPPELRPAIDQTLRIIENRGTIDEVRRQIDRTLQDDPDASTPPSPQP